MQNEEFMMYTYMHRVAFRYTVETLLKDKPDIKGRLLKRSNWHDLDKQLLYMLVDKETASAWHRENCSHHMGSMVPHDETDFMEAVIDYECAGYTKPDKPRNAYDTVLELKPEHSGKLMEIMEAWGINRSYKNTPDDKGWQEYIKDMPKPTIQDAIAEVVSYIHSNEKETDRIYEYANSVNSGR